MSTYKMNKIFTGKYAGRDKFAKMLQFGSRALVYQLLLNDPNSELAMQIKAFSGGMANARKGMRLFKSVEVYQKLVDALNNKTLSQTDLILTCIQNGTLIFRWAYDNLTFLMKVKAIAKGDYSITSNKYRVVATLAALIISLRKLNVLNAKIALAKEEDRPKLNTAVFKVYLELIASCGDMMNALNSSKLYQTNDLIQGVAGFTSAAIGFNKVWAAIK